MTQERLSWLRKPSVSATDYVDQSYRYWRVRVMYSMMVGYAVFYFVRKNMAIASKPITDEFGFSNTQWGTVLSAATIVYAISKFLSGVAADRVSPRYLMSIGLVASALINIGFGFGSSLSFFVVAWGANSIFQGMGMPPCSRLLTSWFSKRNIGKAWGIWNASHQIGAAVIVIWAGLLIEHFGWRYAFFVPAGLALVVGIWLYFRLADSPEGLGLPVVEVYDQTYPTGEGVTSAETATPFLKVFREHILSNAWVWLVSIANFFVYVVQIGMLDWGAKYLTEYQGFTIEHASFTLASFGLSGMVGAYVAGYLSDGIFQGYRGRVASLFMLVLACMLAALVFMPPDGILTKVLFIAAGFFVYGPQLLIGVAAADFAGKHAAAAAVGLTGLLGYFGATLCGIGTGLIVDQLGWQYAFGLYLAAAIVGLLLLMLTWNKVRQV